jgi:hypothetical protein
MLLIWLRVLYITGLHQRGFPISGFAYAVSTRDAMPRIKSLCASLFFLSLLTATTVRAAGSDTPAMSAVRLACDPQIFTASASEVSRLIQTRLGLAPRSRRGSANDLDIPGKGSIQEGDASFQPADELYGDGATHAARLRLLRVVISVAEADAANMRNALDRCTGQRGDQAGGMTTWQLPGHHLLTLDDAGSDRVELTASVDQSDIAE